MEHRATLAEESELDRVRAKFQDDELIGVNEVCRRLGLKRQQLKRREQSFPAPDLIAGKRRLWRSSTVDEYARTNGTEAHGG